jgi:hypothetical protein
MVSDASVSFQQSCYLVFVHSSCCTCVRGVRQQPFVGGRLKRAVTAVYKHWISKSRIFER